MVAREPVLDQLRRVVVSPAQPAAAVVRGDGGIGKSTMLQAATHAAREARIPVRSDAAHGIAQDVPYALIADLFELGPPAADPVRASLGRLVVGEDLAEGFDPYARVMAVTEGLVDLVGAEGASALVVDDLHQADRPSLLVLDRLLRRGPQLGLRAVLATRPSPRPEVQAVIERVSAGGGPVVDLSPLSEDESLQLLAGVLEAAPGPNLTELVRGASGNPLYVAELGRAAVASGELIRQGESADLPRRVAPSSFHAAVLGEISALEGSTVAALRAAAVVGTAFDVVLVAALVESDPLGVLELLRPATAAGVLREESGTLLFRHELVRDALYQEMPVAARAELHRRAASALARSDAGAAAVHLQAAGPPYADADIAVLRAAAEGVLHVDGRRAADLMGVVLEHTPRESPDRVAIRARRAHALVLAGDLDAAAAALAALERDGLGTDLEVGLAMLEAQGARDEPDPDLVRRVWALAVAIPDGARRMETLGVVAYHAARAAPRGFPEILSALPQDSANLPVDARVHFALVRAIDGGTAGDLAVACELASHAYRLAREERAAPQAALRAALVLGMYGGDLGPFRDESREALETATRWAEDANQASFVPIAHGLLASAYWAVGEWEQAEAAYRVCLAAAEEAAVPRWQADAQFSLAHIAGDRGDTRAARAHLAAAEKVGWRPSVGRGAGGLLGRGAIEARIAYGAGLDDEAMDLWMAELRNPETAPFARAIIAMELTVASLAARRGDSLALAAACVRELPGDGPPVGLVRPVILAAVDGDLEAVVAGAEADAETIPVYGLAKRAEIAGLVARDAGDVDTAVKWLREAASAWDRCGAVALRQRTASWLRELGVHTRGRIGGRALSGWDSLTEAERRVVAVAAEGLLYREIAERLHLSRRTVETHVASALRKLDLRNRGELAGEYWRNAQRS